MYLGFLVALFAISRFIWAEPYDFVYNEDPAVSHLRKKWLEYKMRPKYGKRKLGGLQEFRMSAVENPETRIENEKCALGTENNGPQLNGKEIELGRSLSFTGSDPNFIYSPQFKKDQNPTVKTTYLNSVNKGKMVQPANTGFPQDWKGTFSSSGASKPSYKKHSDLTQGFKIVSNPYKRNTGLDLKSKVKSSTKNQLDADVDIVYRIFNNLDQEKSYFDEYKQLQNGDSLSDSSPPDNDTIIWQMEKIYKPIMSNLILLLGPYLRKINKQNLELPTNKKTELDANTEENISKDSFATTQRNNENDSYSEGPDVVPASRFRLSDEEKIDEISSNALNSSANAHATVVADGGLKASSTLDQVLETTDKKELENTSEEDLITEASVSSKHKKKRNKKNRSKKKKKKHNLQLVESSSSKIEDTLPVEAPIPTTLDPQIIENLRPVTPMSVTENTNINIMQDDVLDLNAEDTTNIVSEIQEEDEKELTYLKTLGEKLASLNPDSKKKLRAIFNKSYRRFLYDDVEDDAESETLIEDKPDHRNLEKNLDSEKSLNVPKQISVLTPQGVKIVLESIADNYDEAVDNVFQSLDDQDEDTPSSRTFGKAFYQQHNDHPD